MLLKDTRDDSGFKSGKEAGAYHPIIEGPLRAHTYLTEAAYLRGNVIVVVCGRCATGSLGLFSYLLMEPFGRSLTGACFA